MLGPIDGNTTQMLLLALANVAGLAVLFGSIALCVRFDQQGKTRRRELEHDERMRAIELGRPLDDGRVAQAQALGAIGVVVPLAMSVAAVIGSFTVFGFKSEGLRIASLAIIWGGPCLVCLAVLPVVLARFDLTAAQEPEPAAASEAREPGENS